MGEQNNPVNVTRKIHTLPDPDCLIATTAREQRARCRPGNAFAFGLVALEDAHAFPFASGLFAVFISSLTFPNADVCVEGCGGEHGPGRRPRNGAYGLGVSGGDGGVEREGRGRIRSIGVEADGLV